MGPSASDSVDDSWHEIHGFRSPGEYDRLVRSIDAVLGEGVLVEIPVGARYSGSDVFVERWFRAASGKVWRLVEPDPPYLGAFLSVRTTDSDG